MASTGSFSNSESRRLHRETGSPFDTTKVFPRPLSAKAGAHIRTKAVPSPFAFSLARPETAPAPDATHYLLKRSGSGGSASTSHRAYSSSSLRPMTSPISGRLTLILPSLEIAGTSAFSLPLSPLKTGPPPGYSKS